MLFRPYAPTHKCIPVSFENSDLAGSESEHLESANPDSESLETEGLGSRLVCSVLEQLGRPQHEARQSAMRFRQHNLALFEQMYPHSKDRSKLIAVVKQGRQQLEEQMASERAQQAERRPQGWGGDS